MKPGAMWPIAIVGVLAITVGANGYLLWQARDPSVYVVEPDYYRKAVAWDSTMAQNAIDQRMGWKFDATVGAVGGAGADVNATLADSTGAPLGGAEVRLEAIHNLGAADPLHVTLRETAPGTYTAPHALARAGLWELRFDVRRGAGHFTADLRRDAAVGASGAR